MTAPDTSPQNMVATMLLATIPGGLPIVAKCMRDAAAEIDRLERELKVQKAVNDLAYIPHRNLVESRDRIAAELEQVKSSLTARDELLREWMFPINSPNDLKERTRAILGKGETK